MKHGQLAFKVTKPTPKADKSTRPEPSTTVRHRNGSKHQIGACCSCKSRKKKCDGQYPVCGLCKSSGTECTIVDPTTQRTLPRDYIEKLEAQLVTLKEEVSRLQTAATGTGNISKRDLEMEIGYITLGAGSESKGFLGDSSAYSIAKAITSTISYYNRKPLDDNHRSTPPEVTEELSNIPFTKPSNSMATNYMTAYYDNVHCQYPFLDWPSIVSSFNKIVQQGEEALSREELFFIYMIFAIGSQVYCHSSTSSNVYTKMYYDRAMENINPLVEQTTIQTVQAYLMLSVFAQKMPDASSIWQTIGLAIRTAIILGLHRISFRQRSEESSKLEQLKSRIFWCAYGLERINGITLGRPFSISDIDIDVPTPQVDENEFTSVAQHVVNLRRIQSNIATFVYNPLKLKDKSEDIDSTRVGIVLELNNWMSTFPSKRTPTSQFETRHWAEVSYHNSLLLLLRPVVLEVASCSKDTAPSPRLLEWFKVFTHSASALCMSYKNLHQQGKMGFTWLSMHCIFVSGLSFLYCLQVNSSARVQVLELKRKTLIYDTISACLSILYVFAEKFKRATMFRDTFERVSASVMQRLEGGMEPEVPSGEEKSTGFSSGGVLEEKSIGIDQYLGFDFETLKTPEQHSPSSTMLRPEVAPNVPMDDTLWEFLDTTGDKFLRDFFHDMEMDLSNV